MATARPFGRELTVEECESFQFQFGFVPERGFQIPLPNASLYSPPEVKVGILIACSRRAYVSPLQTFSI